MNQNISLCCSRKNVFNWLNQIPVSCILFLFKRQTILVAVSLNLFDLWFNLLLSNSLLYFHYRVYFSVDILCFLRHFFNQINENCAILMKIIDHSSDSFTLKCSVFCRSIHVTLFACLKPGLRFQQNPAKNVWTKIPSY